VSIAATVGARSAAYGARLPAVCSRPSTREQANESLGVASARQIVEHDVWRRSAGDEVAQAAQLVIGVDVP
jgi:hypothetical protein